MEEGGTARGEEEVKEQKGFAKEEGGESWGKGQREGGQRGQEREGVINEDIARRWRDKEGKKERVKG